VRVSTAFNRILSLPGASAVTVTFTPDGVVAGYAAGSAPHVPVRLADSKIRLINHRS
jgi:hypothetical protein